MQEKTKNAWERLSCGSLVGVANSLFGGGGGMIAVPLLQRTGLAEKQAHATAILVILPVSLFSFLVYAWRGYYRAEVLLPVALGVSFGGYLGARLLGNLTTEKVRFVFAILQAVAGAFMLFF